MHNFKTIINIMFLFQLIFLLEFRPKVVKINNNLLIFAQSHYYKKNNV